MNESADTVADAVRQRHTGKKGSDNSGNAGPERKERQS